MSSQNDLTRQQAELLCMLGDGPVGMTELSRTLHLEKSSLTGLVDRVERRDLVARVRDTHDRRACQITLTPQGAQLSATVHREVTERLEALAAELEPADREELLGGLARILARANA